MDDVGNQTSCRLAGLRSGTVYFVQVGLEAAARVRPWFPTLSANVVCSSGVGALQPSGYLRLSQSWDLERVEPPHRCVNAPQWWAATHIYTDTRSRWLNLQFYFESCHLSHGWNFQFKSDSHRKAPAWIKLLSVRQDLSVPVDEKETTKHITSNFNARTAKNYSLQGSGCFLRTSSKKTGILAQESDRSAGTFRCTRRADVVKLSFFFLSLIFQKIFVNLYQNALRVVPLNLNYAGCKFAQRMVGQIPRANFAQNPSCLNVNKTQLQMTAFPTEMQ